MSGNDMGSGRGQTGLEDVHATHVEERTWQELLVGELASRWKTIAAIIVLFVTAGALYWVDGGPSIDAIVFGAMGLLLAVYFLVTLRSDLKLE
jgi:hypothetical protein